MPPVARCTSSRSVCTHGLHCAQEVRTCGKAGTCRETTRCQQQFSNSDAAAATRSSLSAPTLRALTQQHSYTCAALNCASLLLSHKQRTQVAAGRMPWTESRRHCAHASEIHHSPAASISGQSDEPPSSSPHNNDSTITQGHT